MFTYHVLGLSFHLNCLNDPSSCWWAKNSCTARAKWKKDVNEIQSNLKLLSLGQNFVYIVSVQLWKWYFGRGSAWLREITCLEINSPIKERSKQISRLFGRALRIFLWRVHIGNLVDRNVLLLSSARWTREDTSDCVRRQNFRNSCNYNDKNRHTATMAMILPIVSVMDNYCPQRPFPNYCQSFNFSTCTA